jgi:uncharacterized protein (TIGR00251 family)
VTGPLRQGRGGLILALRVTPKSARDEVTGLYRGADGEAALAVKVTAPPDKGKANKAVIALLAAWAGLPKSAFEVVTGETDRRKSVLVSGNPARLQALIAQLQNDGT